MVRRVQGLEAQGGRRRMRCRGVPSGHIWGVLKWGIPKMDEWFISWKIHL